MEDNMYTYDELSEEAKQYAKERYLEEDDIRLNDFNYYVEEYLQEQFPTSFLDYQYSLSYSQGDGFNISGDLSLKDALSVSTVSEDIKQQIEGLYGKYLEYDSNGYNRSGGFFIQLSENDRYGYSMKFENIKYIDDYFDDFYNYSDYDGEYEDFDNLWESTIKPFLLNVLEYMESLDNTLENIGYGSLYEISDEEMSEICSINDWLFDENGVLQ